MPGPAVSSYRKLAMVKPSYALALLLLLATALVGALLPSFAGENGLEKAPLTLDEAPVSILVPVTTEDSEVTSAPTRTSISPPLAPEIEPAEPDEPPIPPTAVVLRMLRWPDRVPVAGVLVQVVGGGSKQVIRTVAPTSGRLRLADSLREHITAVFVRADGYEPLRVEGEVVGEGIEYLAFLRPTEGWYGQVIDFEGGPVPEVRVSGFWVEDPRPIHGSAETVVISQDVQRRLQPEGDVDPPAARMGRNVQAGLGDLNSRLERAALHELLVAKRVVKERTLDIPKFLAAHDELPITPRTNAEGWYYVEPLPGFVLGSLTLTALDAPGLQRCSDRATSRVRARSAGDHHPSTSHDHGASG